MQSLTPSPYQLGLEFVMKRPGTKASFAMAKLLISLKDQRPTFTIRETMDDLDEAAQELAMSLMMHFRKCSVTLDLLHAADQVAKMYPTIIAMGQANSASANSPEIDWLTGT
ncbi:hypothetical protein HNP46_006734 [Pseudomonas nitritireducens]|uniref:Uncharacterized protein n=1 Tax=Pseudomonas nitroreducens TaxID=46680 RepID=A0A7W7P5K9_PSENT|nr:hypothetical protein [Pseudomonas nitritireducens]MBB4867815.1 hypothetical protein [Pseudomonas nitritireducens]